MAGLFGTDGIRGKANQYPMTPEVALRAGRALTGAIRKNGEKPRVLIGRDTRNSGDMIAYALAAGICSGGGDAHICGVLPTPAVAYLTNAESMDAGVVISASHNPFADNGIKFFNAEGFKLSRQMEAFLEQKIQQAQPGGDSTEGSPAEYFALPEKIGAVQHRPELFHTYLDFLIRQMPSAGFLEGLKVVLDCSNGAAWQAAPKVFRTLGAEVETICAEPDGRNINQGCGSQDTALLQKKVVEARACLGLAFDGDGDRLIAVDENGGCVSGDQILAVCARHLKNSGKLANNRVVSTVMSNVGFHKAMEELGIELVITDVGDRYVLEQMTEQGAVIGGEDSGHMIFLDSHTSGDGILTGLRLIQVMRETKLPLSSLASVMQTYPQVLMNVRIAEKIDVMEIPEIKETISRVEDRLGSRGRVLVRYSGTQPLCRVMVEGPDAETTRSCCTEIVEVIRRKIGAN
ncbi:MAG: phosphoglucosamine mutase [Desulfosalsimonadaceae bacterium]